MESGIAGRLPLRARAVFVAAAKRVRAFSLPAMRPADRQAS
jgi:hypothetical protein